MYKVTKTFTHELGLSVCFRQWRATHSDCKYLHGYALEVELEFSSETLDINNWVIDFGGMEEVKKYLKECYDHKTIVAIDDPNIHLFEKMNDLNIINLKYAPHVGCESFANQIYYNVNTILINKLLDNNVKLESVTVREHRGNAATYRPNE